MTFKDLLIDNKGFQIVDYEFSSEDQQWIIYYKTSNGTKSKVGLTDVPPDILKGPHKFMDEELNINRDVMFIPKNVTDLKAEGWTEADRGRLIKGPFFMGKKKQLMLGKMTRGYLAVTRNMKLAIFTGGYFFLPEQIKYVMKPVSNKYTVDHIKRKASALTKDNLPDFIKTLHTLPLE